MSDFEQYIPYRPLKPAKDAESGQSKGTGEGIAASTKRDEISDTRLIERKSTSDPSAEQSKPEIQRVERVRGISAREIFTRIVPKRKFDQLTPLKEEEKSQYQLAQELASKYNEFERLMIETGRIDSVAQRESTRQRLYNAQTVVSEQLSQLSEIVLRGVDGSTIDQYAKSGIHDSDFKALIRHSKEYTSLSPREKFIYYFRRKEMSAYSHFFAAKKLAGLLNAQGLRDRALNQPIAA